jgi:hypothetical protein
MGVGCSVIACQLSITLILFTAVSVINSDHKGPFGLISQARMAIIIHPDQFEDQTGRERI